MLRKLIGRLTAMQENFFTKVWLIVRWIDWLTGGPVEVTVGFWVLSIDTINVVDMVGKKKCLKYKEK